MVRYEQLYVEFIFVYSFFGDSWLLERFKMQSS